MKHAVVLLSGGLDSATTLAIARSQDYETYALSFDYGQRHRRELDAAKRIAKALGAKEQRIVKIDNQIFAGSALTDDVDVPKSRSEKEIGSGIPPTYVPARNTIFLAHALAWSETIPAGHIFIGANAIDYSGYPDCRPEFIALFETLANVATKAGVLNVDLSLTHSCYDPLPDGRACGKCDSCQLRLKGFREAGVTDPIKYAPVAP
jgi:7-cyano-7-deazaguanine synthase